MRTGALGRAVPAPLKSSESPRSGLAEISSQLENPLQLATAASSFCSRNQRCGLPVDAKSLLQPGFTFPPDPSIIPRKRESPEDPLKTSPTDREGAGQVIAVAVLLAARSSSMLLRRCKQGCCRTAWEPSVAEGTGSLWNAYWLEQTATASSFGLFVEATAPDIVLPRKP